MLVVAAAALALALVGCTQAQQSAWGQCGGIGFVGQTTCVSGYTCTVINAYYSQCIPGTVSTTTTTSAGQTTPPVSTPATPTSTGTIRHDVGKLPALGWNSWNAYGGNINADKILAAANSFVSLGLKTSGYQYVNIDDCWSQMSRSSSGQLVPDPTKFPSGISGVASQVHGLGLKLGIYSDAGTNTCSGYPGSLNNEATDAAAFASWGVDYLKYDNCNVPSTWADAGSYSDWTQSKTFQRYNRMTAAINAQSSPIQFALCDWGQAQVWTWGKLVGHSWRMTGDASASWSFVSSAISNNAQYLNYVDFYAHNDMDMMEIGNGGLTAAEERTHFAAWTFMKSPILLGNNLATMSAAELAIVKNAELLAFHQDATIGTPAKPFAGSASSLYQFAGKSSAGTHVFVINFTGSSATTTFSFASVPGLTAGATYTVHDMWTGTDLGRFTGSWSGTVASHDTVALRLT